MYKVVTDIKTLDSFLKRAILQVCTATESCFFTFKLVTSHLGSSSTNVDSPTVLAKFFNAAHLVCQTALLALPSDCSGSSQSSDDDPSAAFHKTWTMTPSHDEWTDRTQVKTFGGNC